MKCITRNFINLQQLSLRQHQKLLDRAQIELRVGWLNSVTSNQPQLQHVWRINLPLMNSLCSERKCLPSAARSVVLNSCICSLANTASHTPLSVANETTIFCTCWQNTKHHVKKPTMQASVHKRFTVSIEVHMTTWKSICCNLAPKIYCQHATIFSICILGCLKLMKTEKL